MNDLPFSADSGKTSNTRKGKKVEPGGECRKLAGARKQQRPTYIQLHRFTYLWQSIFCVLQRHFRIPHVPAFRSMQSGWPGGISELHLGTSLPSILRFCELLEGRYPVFRMFALKRLSETTRKRHW